MSDIAQARRLLEKLAGASKSLPAANAEPIVDGINSALALMHRQPAVRRAKPVSQGIPAKTRERIQALADQKSLTITDIAHRVGRRTPAACARSSPGSGDGAQASA